MHTTEMATTVVIVMYIDTQQVIATIAQSRPIYVLTY